MIRIGGEGPDISQRSIVAGRTTSAHEGSALLPFHRSIRVPEKLVRTIAAREKP